MKFFKKMIFVVALLMAGSFVFAAEKQVMYVNSNTVALKNKASSFGKTLYTLRNGQEVVIMSTSGSWMRVSVKIGEKTMLGWVKKSALTKKKSGLTKITTDADSISLAGKGSENTIEKPVIDDETSDDEKSKDEASKSNLGDEK